MPDSTIDECKVSDCAGVVDDNGDVVEDESGKPIEVEVDTGSPSLTPEEARARGKSTHEISRHELPDGGTIITERPDVLAPDLDRSHQEER